MVEGKLEDLIRQKRGFLRQTRSDYSSGGNDMLDDMAAALAEAKDELAQRLETANVIREDDGEKAWQKECNAIFNEWFQKWFGSNP